MKRLWIVGLCGLFIGFYDGIFGPGTGTLLVFLLVIVVGYEFLKASATAKLVNIATNFGSNCYLSTHWTYLVETRISARSRQCVGCIDWFTLGNSWWITTRSQGLPDCGGGSDHKVEL